MVASVNEDQLAKIGTTSNMRDVIWVIKTMAH